MATELQNLDRPAEEPTPGEAGQRSLLWPAVAVALASRAALFAFAYFWPVDLRHVSAKLLFPAAQVYQGALGRLLNPWAHWDGVWYIRIASGGYAPFPRSQAFFPLYPLLVHVVALPLGRAYELAGIVVSLACFTALCVLLYELAARQFGARVGLVTVAFLCVFPTSLFFQAVYTESLFLLLIVACFYFSHRGTWIVAGLCGLLATATHVTGIVLVVPMALLYMNERDWSLRRVRFDAAAILLVPAGLGLWMAYLQAKFGDALLFRREEVHWGRRFAWPWQTVWRGIQAVHDDLSGVPYRALVDNKPDHIAQRFAHVYAAHPELGQSLTISNISSLIALVLVGVAIVLGLRRLPLAYTAFMVTIIALPLFGPTTLKPLMSLPRFALAAFPMFIVFALVTDKHPVLRAILLAVLAAGLAYFTMRFAGFRWVA
jgi:Mannosyltransferase (PIG-V)